MATQIPSADEVRKKLAELQHGQLQELSELSGVPVTTLVNIRKSGKKGPSVDTLRRFWHPLLRLTKKSTA